MARNTKYGEFGVSVSRALAERQMTQVDLAEVLKSSPTYVNNTMTHRKPASGEWADLVANALRMSAGERTELHVAAARDAGYKIDLTPPKRLRRGGLA